MDYVADWLEKITYQEKEMAKVIKGEHQIVNGFGDDCASSWLYAEGLRLVEMRKVYTALKSVQDWV